MGLRGMFDISLINQEPSFNWSGLFSSVLASRNGVCFIYKSINCMAIA